MMRKYTPLIRNLMESLTNTDLQIEWFWNIKVNLGEVI